MNELSSLFNFFNYW